MASKMSRFAFLKRLNGRAYTNLAPKGGSASFDVQTTIFPNKLIVASYETGSPVCQVSIQFKAGSRHESADISGLTHVLRICAGLSTKSHTQFAITRNIQQVGGSLNCTTDREVISYNIQGTQENIQQILPFLSSVATEQAFKPWEVSDNIPRLKLELATRPPQQRAVDLLHKAAYRKGLGNSIYISKSQLGKVNSETLQHYVTSNFLAGRAAVVGVGIKHSQLVHYAESLKLGEGTGNSVKSVYKGGEIRSDKGGDFAFIALAGEAAGFNNLKEAYAFEVLKKALGDGPAVKWGNSAGLLNSSVKNNSAVSAFNVVYGDSGLFGCLIAAEAPFAGDVLKGAYEILQKPNISDADLQRGKNQLKLEVLSGSECGTVSSQWIGAEALHLGAVDSLDTVLSKIDAVSITDIEAAARKVSQGKLSIASVGNLTNVPFLDEL